MFKRHYSKRTIDTYQKWIASFINYHGKRHPETMGDSEVEQYLDYLVLEKNVAARTQATALNALAFLYKHIIKRELSVSLNFAKSRRQQKLPIVLTKEEVKLLLSHLRVRHHVVASLMYGSGLRVMEVVKLRVQDIDFDYRCIRVWNGKGNKHRIVTLAA